MCKQVVLLTCCLLVICFTDAAAPLFITKCKTADTKCIKDTSNDVISKFAAGIPEYNIPSLDPLHIKSINASEGNLLFIINDATIVGLRNCEAKQIERDVAKSKMFMKILCSGKLDGQYELKGSILILPIRGKGAVHADLNSVLVNVDADIIEKQGDDGKQHWHIKTWTHSFELQDKSNVVFENLFDGNVLLGRTARELIANNGNEVITEIGPKVVKALVTKVLKSINHFFKAVPYEDLSLD